MVLVASEAAVSLELVFVTVFVAVVEELLFCAKAGTAVTTNASDGASELFAGPRYGPSYFPAYEMLAGRRYNNYRFDRSRRAKDQWRWVAPKGRRMLRC
jgi:hypothetical protein